MAYRIVAWRGVARPGHFKWPRFMESGDEFATRSRERIGAWQEILEAGGALPEALLPFLVTTVKGDITGDAEGGSGRVGGRGRR